MSSGIIMNLDEAYSSICKTCGGGCCEYFSVFYKSGRTIYPNQREYLKEHTAMDLEITQKSPMRFNCKSHKDKKCTDYENRPLLCRTFYCKGIIDMLEDFNYE